MASPFSYFLLPADAVHLITVQPTTAAKSEKRKVKQPPATTVAAPHTATQSSARSPHTSPAPALPPSIAPVRHLMHTTVAFQASLMPDSDAWSPDPHFPRFGR